MHRFVQPNEMTPLPRCEIWKSALRVLALTLGIAVAWGLLEASLIFMRGAAVLVFHRPVSAVNLFIAAVVTYGALGFLLGLLAVTLRLLLSLFHAAKDLRHWPYVLATCVSALGAVQGFVLGRTGPLQGLPRGHIILLALAAACALGAIVIGWLAYQLLCLVERVIHQRLDRSPRLRRALGIGALVVPASLVVAGVLTADRNFHIPGLEFPAVPSRMDGAAPSGPNVILLTIETTRADHVNALGYKDRVTTPNLDQLAAEGALFTRAYAQAPWTAPTMASLFTSRYPMQHGVVEFGRSVNPLTPTLPKVLNDAGYTTVSFYSNKGAADSGFGFGEAYGNIPATDPLFLSPLSAFPFWIRGLHVTVFDQILRITYPKAARWYRDATRMNRAVRAWLETNPATPFLLHVHYLDPHSPYLEHPLHEVQFDPRLSWNRDRLVRRYDGEIRFMDAAIDELLGELKERGLLEDAVVVVMADHGEEFFDHGGWGHRHQVFSELLHVPLIVVHRPRIPSGARVDARVSTVDVAPTILDLLGIVSPPTFEGRSLMPIIGGEEGDREVLSQLSEVTGEVHAFYSGSWKLIEVAGPQAERQLFNLSEDPLERTDLADVHVEVAGQLETALQRRLSELETRALPAEVDSLSPEEVYQLRALGYTQ